MVPILLPHRTQSTGVGALPRKENKEEEFLTPFSGTDKNVSEKQRCACISTPFDASFSPVHIGLPQHYNDAYGIRRREKKCV